MPPCHISEHMAWSGGALWANGRTNNIARSSFAPKEEKQARSSPRCWIFPFNCYWSHPSWSRPAYRLVSGSGQILLPEVPCPVGNRSLPSGSLATDQSAPWKLLGPPTHRRLCMFVDWVQWLKGSSGSELRKTRVTVSWISMGTLPSSVPTWVLVSTAQNGIISLSQTHYEQDMR